MLSFLRGSNPVRTNTAHLNPIFYEDGRSSQRFYSPSDPYMITITHHANHPQHGRSMFNPPLHIHMYQVETFHVDSGVGRWILNGEEHIRRPGEDIVIPVGAYHRYENASGDGEDLAVSFRLDKQDWVMEERFFRNFFGYLDDVRKAGQEPSLFQLMRFLHSVDGPLAVTLPGQKSTWLGRQLSWMLMVVTGVVIGEWILGYKATYDEYYQPEAAKDK